MSRLFLSERSSRARLREAAAAQAERRDIVKALSWGQVSRRDLIKMGLFTTAGVLAPIRGLSPFVAERVRRRRQQHSDRAVAQSAGRRAAVHAADAALRRAAARQLTCSPRSRRSRSNQTRQRRSAARRRRGPDRRTAAGCRRGRTRRSAGSRRAVASRSAQKAARSTPATTRLRRRSTIRVSRPTRCRPAFHPEPAGSRTTEGAVDVQRLGAAEADIGRYGEPILFRHHNRLPVDTAATAASAGTPSRRTSTTATTAPRTTASPARSSSRASSTTTTIRSCSPG